MIKNVLIVVIALVALSAGVFAYKSSQFDFETLEGKKVSWGELQGEWVVVNYFAEWCAPCLKEIPELNAFAEYTTNRKDVSFYALSYDLLSEQELRGLQEKYEMTFPLVKTQVPVMPNARPKSLPATFIISPEGKVVKQLLGEQTNEKLQKVLSALQSTQSS